MYTDGSMTEGLVGGGWASEGVGGGSVALGSCATVWDGEVAGIRQALRIMPEGDLLVLSDSKAAIQAVVKAARLGMASTRDLREVVDMVGERGKVGHAVRFG